MLKFLRGVFVPFQLEPRDLGEAIVNGVVDYQSDLSDRDVVTSAGSANVVMDDEPQGPRSAGTPYAPNINFMPNNMDEPPPVQRPPVTPPPQPSPTPAAVPTVPINPATPVSAVASAAFSAAAIPATAMIV